MHPLLRHPLNALRARLESWWQGRLPLTDHLTLHQRNVYILPTGAGLMLGLTLLVLLLTSINYQLNLGYLLTFLLAGSALAGMLVSHATLRGLSLQLIAPEACYAGATTTFSVQLQNQRRTTRHGIGVALLNTQEWVWCDVPAHAVSNLQLAFKPVTRGLHRLPCLTAQTGFPLGTFQVWALWRPAAQVLVYPTPEASAPALPAGQAQEERARTRSIASWGDTDGLRAYRRGDALKNIAWKKTAKTGDLISRDSIVLQQQALWLEPQQTGLNQPEAQLSRLCAWVLRAEQLGLVYGLRMGRSEITPANGPAHQQRCLQALALA